MATQEEAAGESRRLEPLRECGVLETLPEGGLDELAALAAQICHTPIALISFIDQRRQWVRAKVGVDISWIPRDFSFGAHVVRQSDVFVVPDTAKDERFAHNPLVAGEPHVRFYAGAPLVTPAGESIGVLSVADRVPRRLSAAQLDALRVLGRQVMRHLEAGRRARGGEPPTPNPAEATGRESPAAALRESEERLRLALDAARMGIFDWDVPRARITWSRWHEEMFGLRPGEFDGTYDAFIRRVHPEDAAGVNEQVSRCIARQEPFAHEFRVLWPDGSVHWIAGRGDFTFDADGQPLRMRGVIVENTARKLAEEASREKTAQLQTALDMARMGVWFWDCQSDQMTTLQGGGPISGLPESIYPRTLAAFMALVHADDRALVRERIERAGVQGDYEAEFRIALPDGEVRWVAARGQCLRDAEGTTLCFRGVDHDITARKQSEAALTDHKNRLAAIIENEPECVKVVDRAGRLAEMNRAGLDMLEVGTVAEAQRHQLLNFLLPEHRAAFRELHQRVLQGEHGTLVFEVEGQRGTRRWLETHAAPLRAADGQVQALLGITRDITARRKAEAHIEHLNRVYAVLSSINETIVREKDSRAMLQAACRIAVEKGRFGLAWVGLEDPATGSLRIAAHAGATDDTLELLRSLLGTDDADPDCSFTVGALRTGRPGVCNDIARDAQAAPWRDAALQRGHRALASLPLEAGGRVTGTFNLYSSEPGFFDADELRLLAELAADISFSLEIHDRAAQRRHVDQALRESEERFRQLAENIQEVFWMADPVKKQVLYVSPAYEKIWGRPCAGLYEAPEDWLDAVHAEDRPRIRRAAEAGAAGASYDETYRIVRPDGVIRWIRDRAFAVRDVAGEVLRIVGTAEDITDHRQLEEQLRQSQKMDAIGQLAGGVAHDFNNLLTVIQGYGSLLTTDQTPEEVAEAVQQIVLASERAAGLTRQLLAFSRRQVMQPRPVDLNQIVISLTKMLQRILGADVRLQLDLHPRPLITHADAGMLDQVIMNLVVNARDAMPDGGHLSIETAERTIGEDEARAIPDAAPGRYVSLRITDTGTGISQENLPRVFEPFFTTKEPGKGTGLGLATVFGIVKQHAGAVTIDSGPGRGTTLEVLLRPESPADRAGADGEARPDLRRGTETILLVEDEPGVRMLTSLVLQRQGYQVLEASHGMEALRVLEEHQDSVRLLLTDVVMPDGMNGRQLAAHVRARNPGIKVIFTSGYSADIAGRELSLQEGQNFIQKPFSPFHLLDIVGRCLDG